MGVNKRLATARDELAAFLRRAASEELFLKKREERLRALKRAVLQALSSPARRSRVIPSGHREALSELRKMRARTLATLRSVTNARTELTIASTHGGGRISLSQEQVDARVIYDFLDCRLTALYLRTLACYHKICLTIERSKKLEKQYGKNVAQDATGNKSRRK